MNKLAHSKASKLQFELVPIAPFRLDLTTWVLKRRPEDAVHQWDGETLRRVFVVRNTPMLVEVKQVYSGATPRLLVTVPDPPLQKDLETELTEVLSYVLGLNVDLSRFYETSRREPRLAKLAAQFRGVKPPRFPSVFESFVCAVACQQVSLHVGILLLNRLVETFGQSTGRTQQRAFPQPGILAHADIEQLKAMSFSSNKARYIIEMARAVEACDISLADFADLNDAGVMTALTKIRGVGRWSAEYMMLRGYGRINVYPLGDSGARRRLIELLQLKSDINREDLQAVVDLWKPYSGLLNVHVLSYQLAKEGYVK